jgi:plastocyanin
MKKLIVSFIILFLVILGLFFFKPSDMVNDQKQKFFGQEKILPSDIVVKITVNGFIPEDVSIKRGTQVVWINETDNFAWPASNPHPVHDGYSGFDPEEPFKRGEAWAFKFENVGTWGYHDHLNPNRRARVVVTE